MLAKEFMVNNCFCSVMARVAEVSFASKHCIPVLLSTPYKPWTPRLCGLPWLAMFGTRCHIHATPLIRRSKNLYLVSPGVCLIKTFHLC